MNSSLDRRETVAACPLCGKMRRAEWLKLPDRFRLNDASSWQLVRCLNCGVAYLSERPAPDVLASFYPSEGYDPFVSAEGNRSALQNFYMALRKWSLEIRYRKLGNPKRGNLLLDVGCGTGEFLARANAGGWKGTGVDASTIAVEYVNQRGIPCVQGDLMSLPEPEQPLSAITFWHSLEHVPEPAACLKRAYEWLAPGGRLVVAVPNATSWDARMYQEHWIAYDAPRHFTMFTPESLRYGVEESGFHVKSIKGLWFDLAYNVLFSEMLKKTITQKFPLVAPLRVPIALLPAAVGGEAGASVIVLVADKPKRKS